MEGQRSLRKQGKFRGRVLFRSRIILRSLMPNEHPANEFCLILYRQLSIGSLGAVNFSFTHTVFHEPSK